MDGFWSGLGAPALVNWCEPDYVMTPAVAEFWNTLSSLAIVLIAFGGLRQVRRSDLRFRIGMWGLAAVGAGSAAFHGTLLRVAQAADELPMVWSILACAWTVMERERPAGAGNGRAAWIALSAVAFTLAYARVPWAFALFIAVYAGVAIWVMGRTIQLSFFQPAPAPMRRAAAGVIACYGGGFLLCWVPEHLLLGCDHAVQRLQLHAFWHLGAGLGSALWWEWARLDRERLRSGAA